MPTEVAYPGIYVEEAESRPHTIEGVPTSTAAFVGYTIQGPINQPVRVSCLRDFERTFGAVDPASDVSYAIAHFFLNGGSRAWVTRPVGTNEPAHPAPEDLIGAEDEKTGLHALASANPFNILVIPNQSNPALHTAMVAFAKARRAFAILDLPESIDGLADARAWIGANGGFDRENAAAYFPRILAADPSQAGQLRSLANSGAIAGVYARTDQGRGVWTAPAGVEAQIKGATGLACDLADREQDDINALGLNALCSFVGFGNVIWGARTLAGADQLASEWKYVPVRRTALFVEESLYRGLQWVVFEPNGETLWAEVRLRVGTFLRTLFQQGAFQGNTDREGYFVKCDAETTTQGDIDAGTLNVLVGFAPLKPAEFVLIRITLLTAG